MLKKIREQTEQLIRRIRVRRCETPFVVIFIDRSGSSHFCSALNSHKEILCRGEDFCEVPANLNFDDTPESGLLKFNKRDFYRRIYRFNNQSITNPTAEQVRGHLYDIFSCRERACGFKFKFPIQFEFYPELIEELPKLAGDLKVIALFRKNPLKQAISRQNVRRIQTETSGKQYNLSPGTSLGPLLVDTKRLMISLKDLIRSRKQLETLVGDFESLGMDVMRIEYEDLTAQPEQIFQGTLQFLNVDSNLELISSFGKATPDDLSQAILNYDEVVRAVENENFQRFL